MLFSAIIMGFAGSLHCLGMCSPLAMAITTSRKPFIINRIVYNAGRVLTYGLLGAVVSTFGSLFRISQFQSTLSIFLGSILILMGITGFSTIRIPFLTVVLIKITTAIKNLFATFIQRKGIFSIAFMGMLNGLLPCGLTYLALTYCLTLRNSLDGFFFMLIFGIGTLPAMLGAASIVQSFINRLNLNFKNLTTIVMIVMGVMLISRSIFTHYHATGDQIHPEIVVCKEFNNKK